jgi:hypothetical protein
MWLSLKEAERRLMNRNKCFWWDGNHVFKLWLDLRGIYHGSVDNTNLISGNYLDEIMNELKNQNRRMKK